MEPGEGRSDAVSAQVTAKASGQRVEDTSQRSETSQVFANPDGTWTLEYFTVPVFRDAGDGVWEPIGETEVFDDAGEAFTGNGAQLSVSEGESAGGDGVAELAELCGSGEAGGHRLSLGWEGDLPAPEIAEGQAVYDAGVEVPVATGTAETDPAAPTATPSAETGTAEPSAEPSAVVSAHPTSSAGLRHHARDSLRPINLLLTC